MCVCGKLAACRTLVKQKVMSKLLELSIEPATGAEERIVLDGISWQSYELLLQDYAHRPGHRLNYDEGRLEIVVGSLGHERLKVIIGDLVEIICFAADIECESTASTTFRREAAGKGFEGDDSFYFTHLARIRQLREVDLDCDPAPDLVIEIDLTSPSLAKFPIFAALGAKEVWRYFNGELQIHRLSRGKYTRRQTSRFLLRATTAALNELITARQTLSANAWQRQVRRFAKGLRAHR